MIDRRTIMTAALAAIAAPASMRIATAQTSMSRITAYGFSFAALAGGDIRLADFAGRPFIVVNTASLCGYTPQYAGLQELWTQFHGRGLTVIGVPSNDFGGQEPGGSKEIAETAQHQYGVTFLIAAKAVVKGANAHPFYKWAAEARPKDLPRWKLPQIPDRPRRLYCRCLCGVGRTGGHANQDRHCPRAGGHLTPPRRPQNSK
jgi:glutathione peroxidase